jgi:putative sterol carrier protein
MTDQEQAESGGMGDASAEELAAMIANATDEQIAEGMNGPGREIALNEIFKRMAEHVNQDRAKGTDAVIHFKILDRPDGGYDHYEVVLENGVCAASREPTREPRVTLKIPPVPFIRLVTGREAGPTLFITGKLKIEGDLMFASQLTSMFRIPKAAPPA